MPSMKGNGSMEYGDPMKISYEKYEQEPMET